MKNKIIFIISLIVAGNHLMGQSIVITDPAAQYCTALGYEYKIMKDSSGAEYGVCVFPDSTIAKAWNFYRGEEKTEFSYCAKKGLQLISVLDSSKGYTTKCAYCITKNGRGRIAVRDLMVQNGDIDNFEESSIENPDINTEIGGNFIGLNREVLSFPPSFDWRHYNGRSYIGPIRDQGDCGSCYAFATVASAEGTFNYAWGLYDDNRIELSESFIMWCLGSKSDYYPYFHGCWGTTNHRKEVEALTNEGVCLRSLFPYQTNQPDTCSHWNDTKVKFSGWQRISCNDINAIKSAIMQYGVISTLTYADAEFQNYDEGVYKNNDTVCSGNPCEFSMTNHVVAIVGWGHDQVDGDYWIIRNSWGSDWGENGYMRISMKSAKIACNVALLIPEPATYIADLASHSSVIISGHNVRTIGSSEVMLSHGFHAMNGSEYKAEIQPLQRIDPSCVGFSEFDRIKYNSTPMSYLNRNYSEKEISLYPNPVHDGIYINGLPNEVISSIFVYSIEGKMVMSKQVAPNEWVELSSLPEGMYIVNVVVDGCSYAKKIIKN